MRKLWPVVCALSLFVALGAAAQEPAPAPAPDPICEDCDGKDHQLTGGSGGSSITSPGNAGDCTITLKCINADGATQGRPLVIKPGETKISFSCKAGDSMVMNCEFKVGSCKLTYTAATAADTTGSLGAALAGEWP